eukprot:s194_g33.t1
MDLAMGMDEGVATSLSPWNVYFFTAFDWDRDRLTTLLTNLICKQSGDVPHGQLCHPDYICCALCAPPADTSPDVSVGVHGHWRGRGESRRRGTGSSSAALPRTTRQTKYGRCPVCTAARQLWIFRSGKHAGEAAYVCKKFFGRKKCFNFQIMNRTEINSMTRDFPSAHSRLDNRLKRAGRADAQAHA